LVTKAPPADPQHPPAPVPSCDTQQHTRISKPVLKVAGSKEIPLTLNPSCCVQCYALTTGGRLLCANCETESQEHRRIGKAAGFQVQDVEFAARHNAVRNRLSQKNERNVGSGPSVAVIVAIVFVLASNIAVGIGHYALVSRHKSPSSNGVWEARMLEQTARRDVTLNTQLAAQPASQ
jgi:hypothetical protein